MVRRAFALTGVFVVVTAASGCGGPLTPERVRELMDAPTGTVSTDSAPRLARGFFAAKSGTAAEGLANFIKLDQGQSSGALGGASLADAVNYGLIEDTGDVFCAVNLIAAISSYDACERGDDCEVDLTIDSCVLRLGDSGDEDAKGKLVFLLKNSVDGDAVRSELRITFEDWEISRDETHLDFLDGLIATEVTDVVEGDASRTELIFTTDLDIGLRRKERGLFFDDGFDERQLVGAAMRFTAESDSTSDQGKLELLAFVDENPDGRDQSVVLELAASSHDLGDSEIAEATLSVRGSNGTFACTWSAASHEVEGNVVRTQSAGDCVDEDGETFSFSATVEDG